MWVLKQINGEGYNPKTPYTEDEMRNNYLTTNLDRIMVYKYEKSAKNDAKALGGLEVLPFNVLNKIE